MGKAISMQVIGLRETLATLDKLGSRAPQAAGRLIKNFADTQVVKPAKEDYVPVDTGNLKSSIRASEPVVQGTSVSVTVSAGGPAAPYALSVHENPRAGKTGGLSPQGRKYKHWAKVGQWKYLETPALMAAKNSKAWLQDEAMALLKFMGGK